MELLSLMFDGIDLIAKILGFLALYGIAIALLDWRKTCYYEREFKKLKDE